MVSADSTVVDNDIPSPQGDGVPLRHVSYDREVLASGTTLTFFTSKRFLASALLSASVPFFLTTAAPAGASVMSTSAMVISARCIEERCDDGELNSKIQRG